MENTKAIKLTAPLPCAVVITYIDDGVLYCQDDATVANAIQNNDRTWLITPMCKSCIEAMERRYKLRHPR